MIRKKPAPDVVRAEAVFQKDQASPKS